MKSFFITALAGLLVACGQNSTKQSTILPQTEITNTVSNSSIINVTRIGNPAGRTVVLIPGLASGPEVWADIIYDLNKYDLRIIHVSGFSGTRAYNHTSNITSSIAAAIIDELTEHLAKKPVLIGHSMGGFISLKSGLLASELIDEIIIVDSLPFLAAMFLPGMSPTQAAQSAEAMQTQMETLSREAFDRQQLASLSRLAKNTASHDIIRKAMVNSDQTMVARSMAELLSSDLRKDIAELKMPITVFMPYDAAMGVEKDQMLSLYHDQYKAAPNVSVQTVDKSYHFIMYDQKEIFVEAVKAVLE